MSHDESALLHAYLEARRDDGLIDALLVLLAFREVSASILDSFVLAAVGGESGSGLKLKERLLGA
jgi:hypothetical protein